MQRTISRGVGKAAMAPGRVQTRLATALAKSSMTVISTEDISWTFLFSFMMLKMTPARKASPEPVVSATGTS